MISTDSEHRLPLPMSPTLVTLSIRGISEYDKHVVVMLLEA